MQGITKEFQFIYLGLSEADGLPLIPEHDDSPSITRKVFLTNIFSEKRNFNDGKGGYAYLPFFDGNKINVDGDEYIIGRIGKKRMNEVGLGPAQEFQKTKIEDWRASLLIIGLESKSQIVTIQNEGKFNYSLILKEMISSTLKKERSNPNSENEWQSVFKVSQELLKNTLDFWSAFEAHKGNINKVVLSFNPPNGIVEDRVENLKHVIKETQKSTNANGADLTLNSSDGELSTKDGFLRSCVNYLFNGGGSLEIWRKNKKVFSSRRSEARPVSCDVNAKEIDEAGDSKINAETIIRTIYGFLKNIMDTVQK